MALIASPTAILARSLRFIRWGLLLWGGESEAGGGTWTGVLIVARDVSASSRRASGSPTKVKTKLRLGRADD